MSYKSEIEMKEDKSEKEREKYDEMERKKVGYGE